MRYLTWNNFNEKECLWYPPIPPISGTVSIRVHISARLHCRAYFFFLASSWCGAEATSAYECLCMNWLIDWLIETAWADFCMIKSRLKVTLAQAQREFHRLSTTSTFCGKLGAIRCTQNKRHNIMYIYQHIISFFFSPHLIHNPHFPVFFHTRLFTRFLFISIWWSKFFVKACLRLRPH